LRFGLSKAWRIVTEHGGRLTVESAADAGVTFTIELPTIV
jgi:signal transduction histidine kinase